MTFLAVLITALALCFSYSSLFKIFVCKLQNGRTCDNNGDLKHMKRSQTCWGDRWGEKRTEKNKPHDFSLYKYHLFISKARGETWCVTCFHLLTCVGEWWDSVSDVHIHWVCQLSASPPKTPSSTHRNYSFLSPFILLPFCFTSQETF